MITARDIGKWVLFDNKKQKIIFKLRRITHDVNHKKYWLYGSMWLTHFEDTDYYDQRNIGYYEKMCRVLSQEELMLYQL